MKRRALRLFRGCGVFAVTRAISAEMARILMYHNFSDSDKDRDAVHITLLRSQFEYLRDHFTVVPLNEIIHRLRSGRRLGNCMAALTVDDGRRNVYELMFSLLREFEIPATVFVVSSFIGGKDWVWTDKVLWLSEQPNRPSDLAPDNLDRAFQRMNRLSPEVRSSLIESTALQMGVAVPRLAPPKYAPCTWRELREMADSGLVEIGSHTLTHPILSSVTDEVSWNELAASRSEIEEGIGRTVRYFCFPNGQAGDYRLSHVQQVRDVGYEGAVAARPGMVISGSDPYDLCRIGVSGASDILNFSKHIDGFEHYQAKLQRTVGLT